MIKNKKNQLNFKTINNLIITHNVVHLLTLFSFDLFYPTIVIIYPTDF